MSSKNKNTQICYTHLSFVNYVQAAILQHRHIGCVNVSQSEPSIVDVYC